MSKEQVSVQIKISMRHGHLSEAVQEKIREKVQRLERYFERLTAIEITVDLTQPELPLVNLNVSAEHKHDFVAREQTEDLAKSVDAVVQKMEQQLRRYKEKIQDHHRGSSIGPDET